MCRIGSRLRPAFAAVSVIAALATCSFARASADDGEHNHDYAPGGCGGHYCDDHCDDHCGTHGCGHNGHGHFDCLAHGADHAHETMDGYPFVHLFRTEHAFLETKIQFDMQYANNAEGGEADEWESEAELFYEINNRLAWVLEVPWIYRDPVDDETASGFGDLETGVQWLAYHGCYTQLAFALNVAVPTGDADRDLGADRTVLLPKALLFHDLGRGLAFQGEWGLEVPVDVDAPEDEFFYNMGFSKAFAIHPEDGYFRYVAPTFEVNGHSVLNGATRGDTVVDVTAGLRLLVGEANQLGIAWSHPISGDRDFDDAWLMSAIFHF